MLLLTARSHLSLFDSNQNALFQGKSYNYVECQPAVIHHHQSSIMLIFPGNMGELVIIMPSRRSDQGT